MPTVPFLRPALTALLVSAVALPATAVTANSAPFRAESPPAAPAAGETGRYLVRYAPGTDVDAEARSLRTRGLGVGRTFSKAVRGAVVAATPAQAEALRNSPGVAAVEVDAPVQLSETQQPAPWGLDRVDQRGLPLSGSFTSAASGNGVNAYVIDTGVLAAHTDFGGRVAEGWSVVPDSGGSNDCNGHGTHVAGTIAGQTYGVAKAATIIPVRVLDCAGSGFNSDVVAGLDWVASHHTAGTPAVVNLSLGSTASSSVDEALQAVIDDGVTAVVAAGNNAGDACTTSPARVPDALTVAASDAQDRQASFSNFGRCVDLYAPGVDVTSAWFTSPTASASLSGTSMASPHTAGAAAALLSQTPALTPAEVSAKLIANTTEGAITGVGAGTANRFLYADPAPGAPGNPGTAPTVTARTPGENATGISRGSNITATFSTDVRGLSGSTFVLKSSSGNTVSASVSYNATTRTATLNPSSDLGSDRKYTATLVGGPSAIRDASGTPLATVSWTFTVGPAPTITNRTPNSGATGVRRGNNISVTFSEAVQGASGTTITLKNAITGAAVAATVSRSSSSNNQWTLNPESTLAANTRYLVNVTGGTTAIRDTAGNSLATASWTFTTGSS